MARDNTASALRPWRVQASRLVLVDRWIRVRADDCRTAEGVEVAPFYVLEYPDWVHVVAVSPDQQILLIRQYRHGVAAMSLELPAGGIDAAEDPLTAATRELLEETGCRGKRPRTVHSSPVNPASHSNRVHTVLIEGVQEMAAPAQDPTEVIESLWVSREAAYAAACSGELPALQAASLLAAYAQLGWLTLS